MRFAFFLIFCAAPVYAWDVTSTPLCTLYHDTGAASLKITHDPSIPEYRLELALTDGEWASSEQFGIAYDGARPLTIGTTRHVISGSTLLVRDSGFGNVLDGLEFNSGATAFTQNQSVRFNLGEDAARAVQEFKACRPELNLS